jgi:cytochrome P450
MRINQQSGVLTWRPGHETTSGALSFVTHCLLTNPDAYLKLQAEVDSVIGERTVTLADIGKMPYMTGLLSRNPVLDAFVDIAI